MFRSNCQKNQVDTIKNVDFLLMTHFQASSHSPAHVCRSKTNSVEKVMIFLSFRIYVKSMLVNLEALKQLFFAILVLSIFWGKFQTFKSAKIHKNQSTGPLRCVKMTDFALLES